MSWKHRLKMGLREAVARTVYHTGLHAWINRIAPKRLTILAGHCVAPVDAAAWPGGAHLPADMKISSQTLGRLLHWFAARYSVVTIGEGVRALDQGELSESLVAFSFDDGYRDNHDVLLPLLRESSTRATIFLESTALDERRVNWSHKLFWLLARMPAAEFVRRYGEHAGDDRSFLLANQVLTEGRERNLTYHVKRILKYEGDRAVRDAAIDRVFRDAGGDEGRLCDELYMTWDDARRLRDAGVELGGHTRGHPVLRGLTAQEQAAEVGGGAQSMQRALGQAPQTFAYPFGRRWDFDASSRECVSAAGFRSAVTMHAGVNLPRTDRLAMRRLALDDSVQMHLLVTEACGAFELLRRAGIDLSE